MTVKRTSISLPADLHAAARASGVPFAELIRRGLEGTGDAARHTAAEQRLALAEYRLSLLESRLAPVDVGEITPDDDDVTPEEWKARKTAELDQQAADRHAPLWEAYGAEPVSVFDAATVWKITEGHARHWINDLTIRGLATRTRKHPGQPRDLYVMHEPTPQASSV